jgi:hypothetical protein
MVRDKKIIFIKKNNLQIDRKPKVFVPGFKIWVQADVACSSVPGH